MEEYKALFACGNDTLRYCYKEFRKGDLPQLRAQIMKKVCQEILESQEE